MEEKTGVHYGISDTGFLALIFSRRKDKLDYKTPFEVEIVTKTGEIIHFTMKTTSGNNLAVIK